MQQIARFGILASIFIPIGLHRINGIQKPFSVVLLLQKPAPTCSCSAWGGGFNPGAHP